MDVRERKEVKEGHETVAVDNSHESDTEMAVDMSVNRNDDRLKTAEQEDSGDQTDDEALDLSFASPSIPLKRRRMNIETPHNSTNSRSEEVASMERSTGNSVQSSPRKDDSSKRASTQGKDSSANGGAVCSKGMGCGRPGYITCSICNATKYYSHVQRRFGQFSCEPCSKFMKRFLKEPKVFTCPQTGYCQIGKPAGEQEPRGVTVYRCKACWLKICLEKFILEPKIRSVIDKFYSPKFNFDKNGASKENSISQNYQPPLPLPARKRKSKSETLSFPFTNEPLPKRSAKNQRPVEKIAKTKVNNSNSTLSAPQNNTQSKKPLTVRRESSSTENQSKDLELEEGVFEAYEECGKCTYCLHSNHAKANVVVVTESCKYKKCILSGLLLNNDKEEIIALSPTTPNFRKVVKLPKTMKSDAQLDADSAVNIMLSNHSYNNNKRNSRAFFKRELNLDMMFISDSSFINEILNANSPFL